MRELQLRNRQRTHRVDTALLRSITQTLLEELLELPSFDVAIELVSSRRSAELNEQFLQHDGPTDVITFDLKDGFDLPDLSSIRVAGEIYICMSEAERQAKEFRTTLSEELVRYIVHGVLHLLGYDDLIPAQRKVMKKEENKLVRALQRRFALSEIDR